RRIAAGSEQLRSAPENARVGPFLTRLRGEESLARRAPRERRLARGDLVRELLPGGKHRRYARDLTTAASDLRCHGERLLSYVCRGRSDAPGAAAPNSVRRTRRHCQEAPTGLPSSGAREMAHRVLYFAVIRAPWDTVFQRSTPAPAMPERLA